MKQTTRATFVIDPILLRKLRAYAKKKNVPISTIVEKGINQVMADADGDQLDKQYDALLKMVGKDTTSNPELDNLSVDQVLYGDYDGWRGGDQHE